MMKKAMVVFAAAALFFGCEQPTKEVIKEVPTEDLTQWKTVAFGPDGVSPAVQTRTTAAGVKEGLLKGNLVSNYTLTEDRKWYMTGTFRVGDNNNTKGEATDAVLTVEAGVTVLGLDDGVDAPILVITRGSKIMAEGTAAKPIVFTSGKAEGSRKAGDTGGISIHGFAKINEGYNVDATKVKLEAESELGTGLFGGNDDADNSGVLKYVRIEFSGKQYNSIKEYNGLSLHAVGNGTTISHVQIHVGADDAVEFYGGSVNVDHMILTGMEDDFFDWTSGWTGKAQNVIIHSYSRKLADGTENTAGNVGERGIEADNYEFGFNFLPRSNPVLSNFTIIGRGLFQGAEFRRGTGVSLYNSIITNFANSIRLSDIANASADFNTRAVLKGILVTEAVHSSVTNFDGVDGNKVGTVADLKFPATYKDSFNTNYKPTAAITAATPQTLPAGLTAANYIGAIDPAGEDWTAGWTAFPQN